MGRSYWLSHQSRRLQRGYCGSETSRERLDRNNLGPVSLQTSNPVESPLICRCALTGWRQLFWDCIVLHLSNLLFRTFLWFTSSAVSVYQSLLSTAGRLTLLSFVHRSCLSDCALLVTFALVHILCQTERPKDARMHYIIVNFMAAL